MIRVAIVDDHAIVRAGLRQFFSEQVDLRVTGEAANGREAVDLVRRGEVDVMVMDLSMPEHGGVDAVAAHGLERDLGGEVGAQAGLDHADALADSPVLGQRAARLAHEPYGGDVGSLTSKCADKTRIICRPVS